MLQSKPIALTSQPADRQLKRTHQQQSKAQIDASDDDEVMVVLDEPRRWTKKRRLLAKYEKKEHSGGEDDSGTDPGSNSSSSGSPSDGESCECTNDSGCDDEEDEECEHVHKDHIDELCWQLEENFKENEVSGGKGVFGAFCHVFS